MRTLSVLAVFLLYSTTVLAQVGSVSAARGTGPSHAWAVIERDGEPLLIHVPPRDSIAGASLGEAGSVRPIRTLNAAPDAMVAVGDRLYLFFPPSGSSAGTVRRVLSLRSVPASIQGLWTDVPHGLLDSMPTMPGVGRLAGVAADPEGRVYALTRATGEIALWSLEGHDWARVELPSGFAASEPIALAMVSFGDGLLVASRDRDTSTGWSRSAGGEWSPFTFDAWDQFWDATWRLGLGSAVMVGVPSDDQTESIWSLGSAGSHRIGVLRRTLGSAVVLQPQSGRIASIRPDDSGLAIQELSAITGRVVYEGPVPSSVRVPVNEFRMIVIMVLLVMSTALFVIIKPGSERPWTVPDGTALADPGRRLLATIADVVVIAWMLTPVFGVSIRQILTFEVLVLGGNAWLAIPALAVSGWISMSIWESLLGATPGKFLLGMRVTLAKAGPGQRVPFFWCLVRNGVKWLVCPAAMLALFDPQGRHRGDAAARAVVVIQAQPADPE
ncbi:MAG: RDD family protein [Phycisphaerales bacterium]